MSCRIRPNWPTMSSLSESMFPSIRQHRSNRSLANTWEESVEVGDGFAILTALGQHAKGQRFGAGARLLGGGVVDEDARKLGDLGEPPAVLLSLELDAKRQCEH